MPALRANAATSRRSAPTPDGLDGNDASNETVTAYGYPAPTTPYPAGLPGVYPGAMDVQGRQRVAMNEATFRKVNEGMESGQEPSGLLTFVCECGRLGCNKLIALTRPEYEAVRANPRRFAIVDGHEIDEVEDVVERTDRFIVVEKRGEPEAEVVENTDPRRPIDD
jgi:hypothetical protein